MTSKTFSEAKYANGLVRMSNVSQKRHSSRKLEARKCSGAVRKFVLPLSFMLVVLGLQGCGGGDDGPQRAAVSGVINLDGEPLQQGVIRFVPEGETKGPKTSVPVQQGRFEIDSRSGPLVGEHRIEIVSTDDGGYAMDDEQAIQDLRKAKVKRIRVVKVPAVYNSRSTLKKTVSLNTPNEFQFDLSSQHKR